MSAHPSKPPTHTLPRTNRDYLVLQELLGDEVAQSLVARRSGDDAVSLIARDDFVELRREESDALAKLNVANPGLDAVLETIEDLTQIIRRHPDYASAYVNRAQARRLVLPVAELFTLKGERSTRLILEDLKRGIDLESRNLSTERVSKQSQQLLSSAYAHQAYLLLLAADLWSKKPEQIACFFDGHPKMCSYGAELRSAEDLEEAASQAFAASGRHGNVKARDLAVKTNPYAKMCGAMVQQMMREEYGT